MLWNDAEYDIKIMKFGGDVTSQGEYHPPRPENKSHHTRAKLNSCLFDSFKIFPRS